MATVKKNKKKTIIIAVCAAVIIIAAAIGISVFAVQNSVTAVSLHTVGSNDIYEVVNATGEVSSGAVKEYKVGSVATVKEVFVKTGDEVKQGDLIATFDTSKFDSEIASLQSSYKQAKASYNESVEAQKAAKNNLAQVQKQIAELEKKNKELSQETGSMPSMTLPSVSVTNPDFDKDFTDDNMDDNYVYDDTYEETMKDLTAAIKDLTAAVNKLAGNAETGTMITDIVMNTVADEIQSGNVSSEEIAEISGDAVLEAIKNGKIDIDDLLADNDDAAQIIEDAVGNIDWKDVSSAVSNNAGNAALMSNQLMLTAYYAQEQLYSSMASDSIVSAKKELMNTTKNALDLLEEAKQELAGGWTAAFDGTITECNLYSGEQTTLLSGGITLQNMEDKVVTVSLGEYDIHKVKVGMPVKVSTAYGEYTGSVISKAPVATGGSTSSIMDSMGATMGISGLSSLTQSGAGVEVQISVEKPDEFIVIGFEADVEIDVGEHIGVTTVPSQAMLLDKTGSYVFIYDEEEETVTKTLIETGASSVSEYEIVNGVKLGDRIVLAPQSTFEDSFKVRIKE